MPADWRRYAGPAALLLAATVAVVLIRSGLHSGGTSTPPPRTANVAATTTTATSTAAAKKPSKHRPAHRYWTVQAGDTFGSISARTGVPVATIERLNPHVSSTTLTIGERLLLR